MKYYYICFLFFIVQIINAKTIMTTSVLEIQRAVVLANPGDTVIVKNGFYKDLSLNINVDGINICAESPGGAFFNGKSAITIDGDFIVFTGFQFTSGTNSSAVIIVNGNNTILSELNFSSYTAKKYIIINGQYDTIKYCNFENKPIKAPKGNLIHISTRKDSLPNYALIQYCSFQNMPGNGGDNGNECIRITNAEPSTYKSRTIIEHCYFYNTGLGDSEVISVKSEENIIRYNTMINNITGNFCFRNGNNNIAYSNFFINSGGIRIKEASNIYCYNNYFENCGDGVVTAPVKYVNVPGSLSNINFIHNTFIGGTSIELNDAKDNNWVNNIFINIKKNIFIGTTEGINFKNNIYTGNLGINNYFGFYQTDPKLSKSTFNYFDISVDSPAVDNSFGDYPAIMDIPVLDDDPNITLDIKGISRPMIRGQKDIGCSEYSVLEPLSKPLTLTDVGPSYLH